MAKKIKVAIEIEPEDLKEILEEMYPGEKTISKKKFKELASMGEIRAADFAVSAEEEAIVGKIVGKVVSKVTPKVSKATNTLVDKATDRNTVKTITNTTITNTVVDTLVTTFSGAQVKKSKRKPKR